MDLLKLQKLIDIYISDININLLEEAFTHHSICERNKNDKCICYRRFEILGDSLINFEIVNFLYNKDKYYNRNEISNFKQQLQSNKNLINIGKKLNLSQYLRYDKNTPYKITLDTINSNLVESLCSVIYIDKGEEIVKNFIYKYICSQEINYKNINNDPKSKLNQYFIKNFNVFPSYKILEQIKIENNKWKYKVALLKDNEELEYGEGNNKKNAENNAADLFLSKNNIK